MKRVFLLITLFLLIFFASFVVLADLDSEINQLGRDIETLNKELSNKQANQAQLREKLIEIKNRLGFIRDEIKKKEQEVLKGEMVLEYQKKLLNERARAYYKNIAKNTNSLINLFFATNISQVFDNFFYQKTVVDEDRKTIIKIVLYIKDIEKKKKSLEEEKNQLDLLSQSVDRQTKILEKEIEETKQKIAQLTNRQQALIAQKLASLNISRSAATTGRCDSDLTNGRDPGFSPKFAVFTYGVPNRVGLNQYGAKGRAESGQDTETILRAYYQFDSLQEVDVNINIDVQGYGRFSLEDYVKRIYEMPADWPIEALKAQAIAARSYALAYTDNGKNSICSTEQCQVFKPEEKGGRWNEAVEATRGKVMVKDGQPIKAWYSSTHGGYIFSSGDVGWSATSWTKHGFDSQTAYQSFSDLNNNAYDRQSPWFYCNWGWRTEYNNTAWLKSDELADIVNVILLARYLSVEEKEHLYQTDKPNPAGKENWDKERVKEELKKRGEQPFNNIDSAMVSVDFGYGKTNSVSLTGDRGSVSIDGAEFKNWFNLRAPANIQIVGPLYNIEKK